MLSLYGARLAAIKDPGESDYDSVLTSYKNPREPTGRIVCANCHLANKPMDIEVPQVVLHDTIFEAVVRIPYDLRNRGRGQIYPDGSKSSNNVYNAASAGIGSKIL
ncbi:Apocytochrome f [Morus notabilis]|uniref:Apocytochrome f n=1 Tax=Morus notabilis TaxID=981085 RepID=W9R7C7_9ROSA|nr:Apocytochrome f [Morus notabilis]